MNNNKNKTMNKTKGYRRIKYCLLIQSFCPLFVLLLIKHFVSLDFSVKLLYNVCHLNFEDLYDIKKLGDEIITVFSFVWIIISCIISYCFRKLQEFDFDSFGETIKIDSEKTDTGVSFLVTFVLPLLVNDVNSLRGILFFAMLFFMIWLLMLKTDLCYRNPILIALNYKIFEFHVDNPNDDLRTDIQYIGICRGELPDIGKAIKRHKVDERVFLVYNE